MGTDEAALSRLTLAYEAAADNLKSQDDTLGNIRTRASGVVTIAALLTSFSAGVGLVNTDPERGFVLPDGAAWLLLLILVAIGVLVLSVLWPIKNWHYGPSAATILEKYQTESEAEIRQYIATEMVRGIGVNATAIRKKQRAYRAAVILLLVETVVLVGSLTIFR